MTEFSIQKRLLLDANILIDYAKADINLLDHFCKCIGELNVVSTVLDEVHEISDRRELTKFGVQILEPEPSDLTQIGMQRGKLSFQDRLCLVVAKREGFIFVTNDKELRNECEATGIDVMWGLELLLELFRVEGITELAAQEIAEKIRKCNPLHINKMVINGFKMKLKSMRLDSDQGKRLP